MCRYNSIAEAAAEAGVALTLTCVEMCDSQHPPEALCGPEGLLRQVCSQWTPSLCIFRALPPSAFPFFVHNCSCHALVILFMLVCLNKYGSCTILEVCTTQSNTHQSATPNE